MLMVPKSARAHSIKSRVVPKSAVARERVNNNIGKVLLKKWNVLNDGTRDENTEVGQHCFHVTFIG